MGLSAETIIGKEVIFYGATGKIIGIVKDFNFKPLSAGIEPFIFRYAPWNGYFTMFIKIAPGKTRDVLLQAEKLYKKYEPDAAFSFSFVAESLDATYRDDKKIAGFILFFANLSIFVGCLGLFGLAVFSAEQRIKEIGVRKVLGAGIVSITGLLSVNFLQLVLVGILLAVPVSWLAIHDWLNNFAYRINIDWWVFAIVGVLVIVLAFFTISFQAVKAARANPVKSLRAE
jgi:putative ABC transport system permease protein